MSNPEESTGFILIFLAFLIFLVIILYLVTGFSVRSNLLSGMPWIESAVLAFLSALGMKG
jgi:hypothetical protein